MSRSHNTRISRRKRLPRSCRNHGSCERCAVNRAHFDNKRRSAADLELLESKTGSTRIKTNGEEGTQ